MKHLYPLLITSALLAGSVRADLGSPPKREIDFIPPEWTTFTIHWKSSWDQTLAANSERTWHTHLVANKSLRYAASQIVHLRKIRLLEAMLKRFPTDTVKHRDAYATIASSYGTLGLRWWAAETGWRMARAFLKLELTGEGLG